MEAACAVASLKQGAMTPKGGEGEWGNRGWGGMVLFIEVAATFLY